MPRLSKAKAKSVAAQEGQGEIQVLPPGLYRAKLRDVNDKQGAKGTYWEWVFEITQRGPGKGQLAWENTSLTEAAEYKMKQVFDAFGVPATTDTEDLIGREVMLQMDVRTISKGPRMGEERNEIKIVLPLTDADQDDLSEDEDIEDVEEESEEDIEDEEEEFDEEDEPEDEGEEEEGEVEDEPPPRTKRTTVPVPVSKSTKGSGSSVRTSERTASSRKPASDSSAASPSTRSRPRGHHRGVDPDGIPF
jgi:hypothetical protein